MCRWRYCGFTLGGLSDFNMGYRPGPQAPDYIRLTKVERISGSLVDFTFTASSMPSNPFVFRRNINDGEMAVDYVMAGGSPNYGIGFLVTGNLSALFDSGNPYYIATSITPVGSGPEIEQANIVALPGQGVTSINIGNLPRKKAQAVQPPEIVKVVASGLVNGITLIAGYNLSIIADEDNSEALFTPLVGAGKGEPCGEIERYPGEGGGPGLLSGGPMCSELMYTINGIPPSGNGDFTFRASNGIRVEPDAGNNKVVIIADLTNVVFCGGGS